MLAACEELMKSIKVNAAQDVDRLIQMNEKVWELENYKTDGEEYWETPHPLGAAIEECGSSGVTDIFRLLVERKFMLNEPLSNGWRPIAAAIDQSNLEALKLLLEHGAIVNWPAPTANDFPPPLGIVSINMQRLALDKALDIIDILHSNGAEVNPLDGPTPLHWAMTVVGRAGENGISVMKKFLELGANVNHVSLVPSLYRPADSHIGTPLHAYYSSGAEAVSLLLQSGADVSIENNNGEDVVTFIENYYSNSNAEDGRQTLDLLYKARMDLTSEHNQEPSKRCATATNNSSLEIENQVHLTLLSKLRRFFFTR